MDIQKSYSKSKNLIVPFRFTISKAIDNEGVENEHPVVNAITEVSGSDLATEPGEGHVVAWENSGSKQVLEEPPVDMTAGERAEAMAFLKDPGKFKTIVRDYAELGYIDEGCNCLVAYLSATSRILDEPISILVTGQSSGGKSQLVNTTLSLMPTGEKVELDRITKTVLYYYRTEGGKAPLANKILRINETEGAKGATYPIRALLSERKLASSISVKENGAYIAKEFTVKGPIVLFETTTGRINPENHNRMFEVTVDESIEQTERIHEVLARNWAMGPEELQAKMDGITRRHHNAQRLLKPYGIRIPYADKIKFPAYHVRSRRDFGRFLSLIAVVALLRQYEKEPAPDAKVIMADMQDYKIAYGLGVKLLTNIYDPLKGKKSRELLDTIRDMVMITATREGNEPKEIRFTRADIMAFNRRWRNDDLQRHIPTLEENGYIQVHEGRQGRTYVYSLTCLDVAGNFVPKDLTTPEELVESIRTEK